MTFMYNELERQRKEIGYLNQKLSELLKTDSIRKVNDRMDSIENETKRRLDAFEASIAGLMNAFQEHQLSVKDQLSAIEVRTQQMIKRGMDQIDKKIQMINDFPKMFAEMTNKFHEDMRKYDEERRRKHEEDDRNDAERKLREIAELERLTKKMAQLENEMAREHQEIRDSMRQIEQKAKQTQKSTDDIIAALRRNGIEVTDSDLDTDVDQKSLKRKNQDMEDELNRLKSLINEQAKQFEDFTNGGPGGKGRMFNIEQRGPGYRNGKNPDDEIADFTVGEKRYIDSQLANLNSIIDAMSQQMGALNQKMGDCATKSEVFHALHEIAVPKDDGTAIGAKSYKCLACGRSRIPVNLTTDANLLEILNYPTLSGRSVSHIEPTIPRAPDSARTSTHQRSMSSARTSKNNTYPIPCGSKSSSRGPKSSRV